MHRQAGPDRGRHRLLDQVRLSRRGHRRRVGDGTLLDLGDSRRNSDYDSRMADVPGAIVGARDEVPDHLLGVIEVRNHAVAKGAHRDDVGRRTSQHAACFGADAEHLARAFTHSHDRRFIDDDAPSADVHKRVGGAEIDADVGRPDPQH